MFIAHYTYYVIFILAAGKLTHEIHVSKLTWGEGVGSKEGQTTYRDALKGGSQVR